MTKNKVKVVQILLTARKTPKVLLFRNRKTTVKSPRVSKKLTMIRDSLVIKLKSLTEARK